MLPLFTTTAAYAMNTFASEALNGFSSFQLVFVCNPLDLTSILFPKIDTIPVTSLIPKDRYHSCYIHTIIYY